MAHQQTGPRTPEGKSKSRMNALKSGIYANSSIIPGEDASALDKLKDEYFERFQPPTPEERCLVDALIHNEWLMRRFRRIEAEIFERDIAGMKDDDECVAGHSYELTSSIFARLQRRI